MAQPSAQAGSQSQGTLVPDAAVLLEAWAVLENLTVSLDRIGGSFATDAEVAVALRAYFTPQLVEAIGRARNRLAHYVPEDEAEALSEDRIDYWNAKDLESEK